MLMRPQKQNFSFEKILQQPVLNYFFNIFRIPSVLCFSLLHLFVKGDGYDVF